ncbi:uncharacterized protein LOC126473872 [Schistocerca serialis cubense]|uniref:uncharacterized protein LOC126473872 n=1 Tax=Schistocerca serialis cubense TaxID=2023355 RepID=UPI00214F1F5B|nr:uncharacterized protein LOC126473872 [Schistocerca serialis cubense]
MPSASGFVPASHVIQTSSAPTTAKKRKHSTGGMSDKDDDPLVDITRQQLICMQKQNVIRRAQLHCEERRTTAIEGIAGSFAGAAEAFVGAMKILEEYLRLRIHIE